MFILHFRSFSTVYACRICSSRFHVCISLCVLFCLFFPFYSLLFYFAFSMFLILFLFGFFSSSSLSFYKQTLLARNPTILCLPLNILSLSFRIFLTDNMHTCVYMLFGFRLQANVPMYNNLNPFVMPIYKWGPSVVFCACEKVCLKRFENMINR